MKHKLKRLTALVLALSMCLSLLSATAWAADVSEEYTDDVFVVEAETKEDSSAVEAEDEAEAEEPTEEEPAEEPDEAEAEVSAEEVEDEEDATVSAQATSDTCGTNVTWKYSSGTLTISGSGAMYDYLTEYEWEGDYFSTYGYTERGWDDYESDITSIVINSGVTTVGSAAFAGLYNLTKVTIGDDVTSIGIAAFDGCYEMKTITIPDSVTSVGLGAFCDCDSLSTVTYSGTINEWESISFADGNTCLTNAAIVCSDGTIGSLDEDDNDEEQATSGECGDNVCWELDEDTGVLTISGTGAMDNYGYYYADDTDDEEEDDYLETPWERYKEDILTVVIETGVTSIGAYAFSDCYSLTSVSIPTSVTSIGDTAFAYSGLTSVTIPSSVTSIDDYAFASCDLTSISIPSSVTSVGASAFSDCQSLTSAVLGSGITTIPEGLFANCTKLQQVTVPSSVTAINAEAFYYCESLSAITYTGTMAQWKAIQIDASNERMYFSTITCTDGSISPTSVTGTCADGLTWELSPDYVLTISGTGAMGNYGYDETTDVYVESAWEIYYHSITAVVIESGVTSIGTYAFSFDGKGSYSSLTSVTLPVSVTVIEEGAFTSYSDEVLTDVYYAGSKTDWAAISIGSNNDALTSATIHYNYDSSAVVDISTCTVTVADVTYTGSALTPAVTVTDADGNTLTEGADYTVEYSNNTDYGTGTVTVTGIGSYTGSVEATFTITLATPTLSSISNTTSGVKVTWESVTGAEKYRVFRKVSGGSWAKVGDTTSTSYTDTTAASGTTYYYTVRCLNAAATAYTSSYNSAGLSIKYLTAGTISSLTNTTTGVTVKWSKVTGASGYYVYRKTSSGSYSRIATVTSGSTVSYADTAVTSGTTYTYAIRPYSGSTLGSYTGKSIKYLTAGKISSLTNTSNGITVKWSKVTGASGYYVYRKTSSGSYSRIATVTSGSTVSYTDTAVKSKNGTTYVYAVRPYYSSTLGSYTGKTTVRLTAVSISSLKNSSSKKMTVKWGKNSKATGYQIYISTTSDFSSNTKSTTVSGYKNVSKTISGLTKGKTYYVKVRAYKTVSGTKYYSAWSATKNVKISK